MGFTRDTPHPIPRQTPSRKTSPGQTPPTGGHSQQADIPRADTTPRADNPPPRQMATAADGTHPTGLHSCFTCVHISLGGCTVGRENTVRYDFLDEITRLQSNLGQVNTMSSL